MKQALKGCLITLIGLLVLCGVVIGIFTYQTRYAVHFLGSVSAPDGVYSLTVSQIGDPDWPFGPTHCRVELYAEDTLSERLNLSIFNDGCIAEMENFTVIWETQGVTVIAHGCEQEDASYHISFPT